MRGEGEPGPFRAAGWGRAGWIASKRTCGTHFASDAQNLARNEKRRAELAARGDAARALGGAVAV